MAKAATQPRRGRRRTSRAAWPSRIGDLTRRVARDAAEHELPTYTSAIAFRALVALIPLTLLGLGLLGAFGLRDTWTNSLGPAIEGKVSAPVYAGIDYSVRKILTSGTAGLITFAALLAVWDLTWGMRTVMDALNRIHGVEDKRPWQRKLLVALALAVTAGGCLLGAVLILMTAPRAGGSLHLLLSLGRWPVAVGLLVLAVGLLVRYGPAEHPEARWASAGSVLVIVSWIVASLCFRWWVSSVANFRTAIGSLTVFLVMTSYLFVSCFIFLAGVQLDEILRKEVHRRT
jgi:membrane protein